VFANTVSQAAEATALLDNHSVINVIPKRQTAFQYYSNVTVIDLQHFLSIENEMYSGYNNMNWKQMGTAFKAFLDQFTRTFEYSNTCDNNAKE
jgi:hypothetical protein